MGATSKAAQSFCANRIRTRSFFDFTFEQPCVFIPRAPSSSIGGCHLTLGTVRVKSWFEEARGHRDEINLYFAHSSPFSNEVGEILDEMDWWRVLDISLRIGIKIEVSEAVNGVLSEKDTVFNANLIARKPSSEETTIIQCSASSLDINLKYTEFMILNLVALENIGQPIDESKWDNIEKSFWQNERDAVADALESSLVYADTARIVRFGETNNTCVTKEGVVHFEFLVDSINVTLHR